MTMSNETIPAQYIDPRNPRYLKRDVMIYSRYERFWHWSQAALIFTLFFSGLGLHGTHSLLDFRTAVTVHTFAAIALIVLWVFTTFWNFTTGQWKQYLFKRRQCVTFYHLLLTVGLANASSAVPAVRHRSKFWADALSIKQGQGKPITNSAHGRPGVLVTTGNRPASMGAYSHAHPFVPVRSQASCAAAARVGVYVTLLNRRIRTTTPPKAERPGPPAVPLALARRRTAMTFKDWFTELQEGCVALDYVLLDSKGTQLRSAFRNRK